jgi:hypothetical protein
VLKCERQYVYVTSQPTQNLLTWNISTE